MKSIEEERRSAIAEILKDKYKGNSSESDDHDDDDDSTEESGTGTKIIQEKATDHTISMRLAQFRQAAESEEKTTVATTASVPGSKTNAPREGGRTKRAQKVQKQAASSDSSSYESDG